MGGKIIRIGEGRPHDCRDEAPFATLTNDGIHGDVLPHGTVWRCECGKLYVFYGDYGLLIRDATLRERFRYRKQ
jgi:hypothetical protein